MRVVGVRGLAGRPGSVRAGFFWRPFFLALCTLFTPMQRGWSATVFYSAYDTLGNDTFYADVTTAFTGSKLSNNDSLTGYVTLGYYLSNPLYPMNLVVSGTVTLNTVGRVSGTLKSDGSASLYLQDDLVCSSTLLTTGHMTWQGQGYNVRLLKPLTLTGSNCWQATASSNLIVDGQLNSVTLGGGDALRIDAGVSVTLRNMTLIFSSLTPIWLAGHSSTLTLDNVNIVFNVPGGGTYKFNSASGNGGQLWIANNVILGGVGANAATTFSYNSNHTLGIGSGGQLRIGNGINFSYEGSTSQGIVLKDATSKLRFDNSTLTVSSGVGLNLLKGMLIFDNLCHVVNTGATSSTGGIVLGDGTTNSNNVDLRLLAEATLIVDGYLGYNFKT